MAKEITPVLPAMRPADDCVEIVMSRLPPGSDLVTIPDVSVALNVANNVVRAWTDDGRLPSLPCGAGEEREFRKISRNTFRRFLEMRRDGVL